MKKILLFSLLAVLVLSGSSWANIIYQGSLNGGAGGGITATADWNSSSTTFEWKVEEVGTSNGFILWKYDYTFTVPKKNISHMIIEVSPDAGPSDFSAGLFDDYSATSQGNSNPGMPSAMKGLKFQPGTVTLTASFTTTRAPVWGDFYAKDGQSSGEWVTAWNTGFTNLDTDPLDAPANGSINHHILRPDTQQIVPIPGTVLLLGSGLAGLVLARRKK
jgi:hypothetical protein